MDEKIWVSFGLRKTVNPRVNPLFICINISLYDLTYIKLI
jgi:hypothetical protein